VTVPGRSQSFGANAERYDRARPSYAAGLVDDLLAAAGDGPGRVLDVGCGTGIAARLFAARGCDVLGVEPDERMATVARRHGLAVEITPFEFWDPAGRAFDLVISGQAWHWVDPEAGARQAATALRPGGQLALFWNALRHPPEVVAAMTAVYQAHAPALLTNNLALGAQTYRGLDDGPDTTAIVATGQFDRPGTRRYDWDREYTTTQWLDELPTHSNHALLPPATLAAVLAGIGAGLAGTSSFTTRYRTVAIVARRAG
jgi:SAM-dependent methyltransferase